MKQLPKRHIGFLAVAVVLLLAGCSAAGPAESSATEVAERMQEKHDRIDDIRGEVTITYTIDGETTTMTQRIWERPPDEMRTEVLEDSRYASSGDVFVFDGSTAWSYDDSENAVTVSEWDIDRDALRLNETKLIEDYLDRYDLSYEGSETVADRQTHVIELERTESTVEGFGPERMTLWVDTEFWYPIKQEWTTSLLDDEPMTMSMTYEEIAFNEGIDDSIFTFEPPADATVTEGGSLSSATYDSIEAVDDAVEFAVPDPDVPAGYSFEHAAVSEFSGTTSVHLSYRNEDADDALSVSATSNVDAVPESESIDPEGESIDLGETEGIIASYGELRSISWTCDKVRYTVSGSQSTDDLRSIAESIGC